MHYCSLLSTAFMHKSATRAKSEETDSISGVYLVTIVDRAYIT